MQFASCQCARVLVSFVNMLETLSSSKQGAEAAMPVQSWTRMSEPQQPTTMHTSVVVKIVDDVPVAVVVVDVEVEVLVVEVEVGGP